MLEEGDNTGGGWRRMETAATTETTEDHILKEQIGTDETDKQHLHHQLRLINEDLERAFADPNSSEFSARNVVPRLISRSLSVIMATTIASMLPFFGDIMALIGAFGFIPFFGDISAIGIMVAVAAIRQIGLDAKTYKLFANV
nr:hypothetical protein [Tanacetum cinerariifolium]